MIDKNRVLSLLATLEDYLKELRSKTDLTIGDYKNDLGTQRIVERLLQLISEAELDISEEIDQGEGLKLSAEENSMLLALDGGLGKETVHKLIIRRNLRNMLVHAYTSYTAEEVFGQAKDISDVTTFVTIIKKLLR